MANVPDYVEARVRRAIPENCSVVPGSTPVVSFGDIRDARVATLGLNPSWHEFWSAPHVELNGDARRFETLASLGCDSLEDATASCVERVWEACNIYFQRKNPYWGWFDPLQEILEGVKASYEKGSACHLDLVQWATYPAWRMLDTNIRRKLLEEDTSFFVQQVESTRLDLLLLNGISVMNGFTKATGNVLRNQEPAITIDSITTGFSTGTMGATQVIAWTTNLQSTPGVTPQLRKRIAKRVAELAGADSH